MPRRFAARVLILTAALALALMGGSLGGCRADHAASGRRARPAPTLADAAGALSRGDYAKAYRIAAPMARSRGVGGNQAAYIAGIAAKSLGRASKAERYLRQAAGAKDDHTAGNAGASLGLLYARRGRYAQSAHALLRAAPRLTGEDRAQAYFYAAVAQQKLGQWAQARTNLVLARGRTHNRALHDQINRQLAVTGYTIQVGAFQKRPNAKRLASRLAAGAAAQAVGDPRLVTGRGPRGGRMYLVQIGRFATFESANHVRTRIGRDTAIIVPLAGGHRPR